MDKMESRSRQELLLLRCEKLRKKVKDWEIAIYKTEGRKPNAHDMKQAPKDVQESYREYSKVKKYLADGERMPKEKNEKLLTPGKIFLGKRRLQHNRSELSNSVRTPMKMFRKSANTSYNSARAEVTSTKSLGLRPSRQLGGGMSAERDRDCGTDSSSDNPFQKLFTFKMDVVGINGNNAKECKESESLPENVSKDVLENNVLKKSNSLSVGSATTSVDNNEKIGNSSEPNDLIVAGTSSFEAAYMKKLDSNKISKDEPKAAASPALKSPIVKSRLFSKSSRKLDARWLERVNYDDETMTEDLNGESKESVPINTSGSDLGVPKSPEGSSDQTNNSKESILYGDESMTMEAECDAVTFAPTNVTHENTDSGICMNIIFNSEELQQAVQEVLVETKDPNDTSNISISDGSLLYSFSEDACHPSDHEDPKIDSHTMANIMQVLSENISEDECSTKSGYSDKDPKVNQSRKRSAKIAFSPSPKKPMKEKKFFKSNKGERVRHAYSTTLFRPLSPIKKLKKSYPHYDSKISANEPTKIILKKTSNTSNQVDTDPFDPKISLESESVNKKSTNLPTSSKQLATSKRITRRGRKVSAVAYAESDDDNSNSRPVSSFNKKVVVDAFDEASAETSTKKKKPKFGSKRRFDSLESKINKGKLDENYVRIDTTRKVFVRGHRKINVSKLKLVEWKNRKMGKWQGTKVNTSTFTCHKCGEKGHFAKFCAKDASTVTQDEIPAEQQDNSPFPSLEEAAMMVYKTSGAATTKVNIYTSKSTTQLEDTQTDDHSDQSDAKATFFEEASQLTLGMDPVFDHELSDDADYIDETLMEGLQAFGYDNFRPGQKDAILRVLKGLSTLLILSTGAGKSLCYQLPAYLYGKKYPGALTLCVSPLVSLMEDQIQGTPSFLGAACLHSNMTEKQRENVLDKVKSKKLNVLLVSPEAVCGGLFGLLRGDPDSLPKISFACIDEVHCVSQWSHNFRPSYLQLCKILREKLSVKTILGLTATATKTTAESICEHLNIDPSTAIRGELIPRNLQLSVSRDLYKDEALITLLRGERFCNCDSIIIYCTRREQCERIATFVRIKLQEVVTNKVIKTKSGARLSGSCEAYHAGMTPRRRKNVQEGFMSGAIRIVVATVAFGMGIDKSDIRAVIHYNMPSAFESYVQEIGRAGRDGLPAHCHLFLDNTNRNDLCELKRHVYANSVDRPTVRKLLRKVFQTCKCKRIQELKGNTSSNPDKAPCQGHEVSFSIDKCVLDLDLPKENITTLLCYLELGDKKWIDMLPLTYETCKIQSYGGPKLLKSAASRCPPLAVAIALQKEKNDFLETDSFIEFNVIEAAATVGWNSAVVKRELRNLIWVPTQYDEKGNPTRFRKSGLIVEFSNLAYRVRSIGSLSEKDADEVLNSLHGRNMHQEKTQLYQLNRVYQALLSVSFPNINNLCETFDEDKSEQLKKFIFEYFSEVVEADSEIDSSTSSDIDLGSDKAEDIRRSIRRLVDSNRDLNFTPRSVAKIFQGISSPCFPADVWFRNRDFWRRYLDVDFHTICRLASEEL